MSATTLDQQISTATTEYNVSQALHTLADMFYVGSIPEQTYPDQSLSILVAVPTAEAVIEFAVRMGTTINSSLDSKGDRHTSTKLPIGTGTKPGGIPEYAAAVVVTVSHIARDAA